MLASPPLFLSLWAEGSLHYIGSLHPMSPQVQVFQEILPLRSLFVLLHSVLPFTQPTATPLVLSPWPGVAPLYTGSPCLIVTQAQLSQQSQTASTPSCLVVFTMLRHHPVLDLRWPRLFILLSVVVSPIMAVIQSQPPSRRQWSHIQSLQQPHPHAILQASSSRVLRPAAPPPFPLPPSLPIDISH